MNYLVFEFMIGFLLNGHFINLDLPVIHQFLRPTCGVIFLILSPDSVQDIFLDISGLHYSRVCFFTVSSVLCLKFEFKERVDGVFFWLGEHTQSVAWGISSLETLIKGFFVCCHNLWAHDWVLGVEYRNCNSFSLCHKTAILPICLTKGVTIIVAFRVSIGKSHLNCVCISCCWHSWLLGTSIPWKLLIFCSSCICRHKSPVFIVEYIGCFESWSYLSITNIKQALLALAIFLIWNRNMIFGEFKWIISNCLVWLDSLTHSGKYLHWESTDFSE